MPKTNVKRMAALDESAGKAGRYAFLSLKDTAQYNYAKANARRSIGMECQGSTIWVPGWLILPA